MTGSRRVVTVPNAISFSRVVLTFVFAWMARSERRRGQASVLLAVLGVTDFADGWLARHLGQVSKLGTLLDPAADRLLVVTALATGAATGAVPAPIVVTLGLREVLVAGAAAGLGLARAPAVPVSLAGKAGSLCMMTALPTLLFHDRGRRGPRVLGCAGLAAAWLGVALGWYALLRYVPPALDSLRSAQRGVPVIR
ncbi:MAG: CDP-alcohol phosphatidyltransferase family protein [Acidimicrobiales bacterium]